MALYAVKIGKECNKVVESWDACKNLTEGVPFAKYRKVANMEDAEDFLYGPSDKAETGDYNEIDVCYLFSDGSCSQNPGPGGWGTIVKYNGQVKELAGGSSRTTNNQMEMQGLIEGFKYIVQNCGKDKKVVVYSDSSYVINGASKWMYAWEENGWQRKGGEIANLELWQEIFAFAKMFKQIEYHWIRGHNGHKYNERCDKLAVSETKKQMKTGNADNIKVDNVPMEGLHTNYDLFKVLNKEDLLFLLTSIKFKNFLLSHDAMRVKEMLEADVSDWGVISIKERIERGGLNEQK